MGILPAARNKKYEEFTMAIKARALFITTLAMTSGTALAGAHGESFSTCGTDAHAAHTSLAGAGIIPARALEYHLSDDQIAALNQPQRDMMMSFERLVHEGNMAPHVCMHPDTDPKVAEAFEQFLNNLWFAENPNSFILSTRWTRTATDGSGLSQGDPTTLTYSFVPDGTNISGQGPSDLINFMDTQIGSGTWEALYQTALDAWGEVSGLTYVREMNDDGGSITGGSSNNGILGVRGDVRIAGDFLDGNSGVLAYNFFPNAGDMVMDTGDVNFFRSSSNNYIRLRNVVTHEAGHGIGLAHVESDSNRFLMEPFIDISFSGPQIDDVRGAQRGYGDMDENNNSFATASDLNQIFFGDATPIMGGQSVIASTRSTDDNADIDYFTFVTSEPVSLNTFLGPSGGSYQITGQGGGGGGSFFNASAVSDLNFKIINSTLTTLYDVDNTGTGQSESQIVELPDPGQYYLVVDSSNVNNIQTYDIVMFTSTLVVETCDADLNGDGELDFLDISEFLAAYSAEDPAADFNGDMEFDFLDISAFLTSYTDGCP